MTKNVELVKIKCIIMEFYTNEIYQIFPKNSIVLNS